MSLDKLPVPCSPFLLVIVLLQITIVLASILIESKSIRKWDSVYGSTSFHLSYEQACISEYVGIYFAGQVQMQSLKLQAGIADADGNLRIECALA